MKIAYIINRFPALYTTFILNDMIRLQENHIEVYIFSLSRSAENVVHEGVSKLKSAYYFVDYITDGYFKKYLSQFVQNTRRYNPFYRRTCDILFKRKIKSLDTRKYFKNFGLRIYAFNDIANIIRQEGIDIIHGAFGNQEATAAMILSELTGIPFTFETHANDLFVHFPYFDEKFDKAEEIFTISHYNKTYLTDYLGCPASKVTVKRVSFNKNYCDEIPEKKKEDNLILSVCRLNPIKGIEYAIEAFGQVSQKRSGLHYVIIGDGPIREQLVSRAKQFSSGNKVTFLGNVSNEDVLDYVSRATLVVMPSVIGSDRDRDGIPTALIEAMYLRTPVIGSRVSGIPELIDDGISGFLTEPKDVNQIAGKMDKLLSDETLRIQMGERAREKVKNEFNMETSVMRMIETWQKIVA